MSMEHVHERLLRLFINDPPPVTSDPQYNYFKNLLYLNYYLLVTLQISILKGTKIGSYKISQQYRS